MRILGSNSPKRISDTKVPSTVMTPNTITIVADMNMSSANNALSSKGPSVGRFNTTETIIAPEIKNGSKYPKVLINGLSATLTGYFIIIFHSFMPFARAVITYGLLSSSSRFALITLINAAVPAVPTTKAAIHRCSIKFCTLAHDHGSFRNAGSNRPPTLVPKYQKETHMSHKANRKSGTANPKKPTKVKS